MAGLSSNQIKFIRSLSQKKFRQESGLFVAEGEKIVNEALSSPFKVKAVYRSSEIGEECMKRISNLASPSPVLAVIEQRREELRFDADKLAAHLKNATSGTPLFLALDGVKDPGNMGTIIRSADALGAQGIILSKGCVDIFNPKVVRSTMASLLNVPVFIDTDTSGTFGTLKDMGYDIVGTFPKAKVLSCDYSYSKKTVLVMGNEANGISQEVENHCTSAVTIPMLGNAESLNVATACTVMLYEIMTKKIKLQNKERYYG